MKKPVNQIRKKGLILIALLFSGVLSCKQQPVEERKQNDEIVDEAAYNGKKYNKEERASESYYQETDGEPLFVACLTLFEDGTFEFMYDVLSSYFPRGAYVEKEDTNEITALTADCKYQYVFERIDENTLAFNQEQSSDVTYTLDDLKTTERLSEGALFVKREKE